MIQPVDHWDNVPVFSSDDIEIYGQPDYYGFTNYYVIETDATARPFESDFHYNSTITFRPIHRYNRIERFNFTLSYLVGYKGTVPQKVLDACSDVEPNHKTIWNDIKIILKKNKWNIYYNRISLIINSLGLSITENMTNTIYEAILYDFLQMHNEFESSKKKKWNRRYFLNLKFVAMKLLDKYNIRFKVDIPLIKTQRKLKILNELWEDIL